MRRDDVASTSIRRHFDVICPLGYSYRICSQKFDIKRSINTGFEQKKAIPCNQNDNTKNFSVVMSAVMLRAGCIEMAE